MTVPVQMPTVAMVEELPALAVRRIPAEWLDQNGHVNVRHYLGLYDDGGWPLMEQLGVDESYYRDHRNGLFDLEHHIWYLAELHVGEEVSIHARMLARTAKRFHGLVFVVNRTRRLLASAIEYVTTGADLDTRRTAPLPPALAARLDAMIEAHARLSWPAPVSGAIRP